MQIIQQQIADLLVPISQESPGGINIEYEQIYDDIRKSRISDPEYFPKDDWSMAEPRRADWNKVRELCETALIRMSKDLQVGCWLVEALTHLKGIIGAEIGLQFLSEFIARYWFQCWPALDEEGASFRYGKLVRLDQDISLVLCTCNLFGQPESSLAHWRKVLAFEHKISTKPNSRSELIAEEGDLSMKTFDSIATSFSSIEISQHADTLTRLLGQVDRLEACYFSLCQDEPHSIFSLTRQSISGMRDFLQNIAQRIIPAGNEMITLTLATVTSGTSDDEYFDTNNRGQTLSRGEAISQMMSIAHFFRQTEPSSPVPFLMDRAVRWANMTLTEWLEEMLSDSNSLREIDNVLNGHQE